VCVPVVAVKTVQAFCQFSHALLSSSAMECLARDRSNSRSPRRSNVRVRSRSDSRPRASSSSSALSILQPLSEEAYSIVKCALLCEEHNLLYLPAVLHKANDMKLNLDILIPQLADETSQVCISRADAMGYVEKVVAKWGLLVPLALMDDSQNNDFPGIGEEVDEEARHSTFPQTMLTMLTMLTTVC